MSRRAIMTLCICIILIGAVYVVVQLRRRRPPCIDYLYAAGWFAAAVAAAVLFKQRAVLILPALIYKMFRIRMQQDQREREDNEPESEFWKAERDAEKCSRNGSTER